MSIRALLVFAVVGLLSVGCQSTPERTGPSAQEYYLRGLDAFERGEYRVAAMDLEQSVSLDPNHGVAYCLLGETRVKLDRVDMAIDAYSDCLEIQPGNGDAHAALGDIYIGRKQYALAQRYLKKAVEYLPADAVSRFNLAEIYRKQGKCSKPLALYAEALSLRPDFVDAQEGRRRARKDNCRTAKAKAPARKESEFVGGGKALKPSDW